MPSYEYRCPKCDAIQVETFPITVEIPVPSCPNCSTEMTRVFGSITVTFRGDGWGKDPN